MTIKKDLKTRNLKRPNYTSIPSEKQENIRKIFGVDSLAQLINGAFSINLTTRQALVLDRGRHSSITTESPV